MTKKEWKQFLVWKKSHKKKVDGYILLYPSSIKYIDKPSYYDIERAEKGRSLYFTPDELGFNVTEEGIKARTRKFTNCPMSKLNIPFNHIMSLHIYNYNR